MAQTLARLVGGPLTGRQKLVFVAQKAFPPPAYLRLRSRLANRGTLGLAAAYVVRIASRAWRLPGGVRALRRARREASRG